MDNEEVEEGKMVECDTGSRWTKNSTNADGKKTNKYIIIPGSKNQRKIKFIGQLNVEKKSNMKSTI